MPESENKPVFCIISLQSTHILSNAQSHSLRGLSYIFYFSFVWQVTPTMENSPQCFLCRSLWLGCLPWREFPTREIIGRVGRFLTNQRSGFRLRRELWHWGMREWQLRRKGDCIRSNLGEVPEDWKGRTLQSVHRMRKGGLMNCQGIMMQCIVAVVFKQTSSITPEKEGFLSKIKESKGKDKWAQMSQVWEYLFTWEKPEATAKSRSTPNIENWAQVSPISMAVTSPLLQNRTFFCWKDVIHVLNFCL